MYKAGLEDEGHQIIVAKDGEEGFIKAKEGKPDLILLDIILPKIDGFGVLKKLKEDATTKGIMVVMLTNLGQEDDKGKAKKIGAIDYWVKADYTPSEVSKKIGKLLS